MKPILNFPFSLLIAIVVGLILLASCQPAPTATEESSPTDLPPTATATTKPEMTETVAEEPVELSACLECHSDKQMLIDTAKPEEEKISENEGAG